MKPVYYYNGETVSGVRFYKYGENSRVEFVLNGKRMNVPASNVTTDRFANEKVEAKQEEVKPEVKKEVVEKKEVKEETTVEPEKDSEPVEEGVEEPLTMVKVTDLDGNEDEDVYDFDSQEFTDLIEKHGWDVEAIERVLNGEQKTHKGYTFELV